MDNQGLFGALNQYWSIDEKPRLHRRNTYFDEVNVSNTQALRFGLMVSLIATAVIVFWSILGVLL